MTSGGRVCSVRAAGRGVRINKAHGEIRAYNREAWDRQVAGGKNQWTVPVSRSRFLEGDLEAQIGGQLEAGFLLAGFYEDNWPPSASHPLSRYMPCFFATRAVKPLSD